MSKNIIVNDDLFNLHKRIPEGTKFDLIIADPPYGNVVNHKWDKIENINNKYESYQAFTAKWLEYINKHFVKQETSLYVFCSLGEKSSSMPIIWQEAKSQFNFKDMIVWSKQRGRGNRKGWLFTREELLWFVKSKEFTWNKEHQYSTHKYHESWIKRLNKENNPYKRATNVWTDIKERSIQLSTIPKESRKNIHPTQKPVTLIERIIKSHFHKDMLVLDLFSGSGTTSVVCKLNNINSVGVEIDTNYYNLIIERMLLNQACDKI